MKRLMMCSMYWGLDMVASIREMLEEENIRCDKEIKEMFGQRALEALNGSRDMTLMEYAGVCHEITNELEFLNGQNAGSISTNMEALLFFANQIVKVVEDVSALITLLGFEDEVNTVMNELGKEVMGFKGERSKVVT